MPGDWFVGLGSQIYSGEDNLLGAIKSDWQGLLEHANEGDSHSHQKYCFRFKQDYWKPDAENPFLSLRTTKKQIANAQVIPSSPYPYTF